MSAPVEPGPKHAATSQEGGRRHRHEPVSDVRTADLEPYLGLRYLSKLFRLLAIVLVLLLVAEVATGLIQQGTDAIATLVAESSRLIVLAGLLWGFGDLVLLLIDLGHDVRAGRILLGRQVAHQVAHQVVHQGHGPDGAHGGPPPTRTPGSPHGAGAPGAGAPGTAASPAVGSASVVPPADPTAR